MVFKKLQFTDLTEIAGFLRLNKNRFCDLTPGTLFMWAEFFDNRFCIVDGALIISGRDINGQTSFSPPLCTRDNEAGVLQKLYAHAKKSAGYLKLYPVPEDKLEYYKNLLGGNAVLMEDWSDYIYSADDLLNLSGKKYHGQRNHINRFMRENASFSFDLIDQKNLSDVLAFAQEINKNAGNDKLEAYESLSVLSLLNNYDTFGQTGFLLRINGSPAGFVIGEVLGDTLYEHIEKADKSFAGIFPFMSNLHLKKMKEFHPEIALVNREEDLGDPGIRYSKECYHPLYKNYKYFIICE